MGILADFFVATADDARQYALPSRLSNPTLVARIAPAQYKHFTPVELGTLWAILQGATWDPARYDMHDESIPGDEDSWLFRFPAELTELLAAVGKDELQRITLAWSETKELSCAPGDLVPVVVDLQRLAAKARETASSLYLWGCT